jgi:hypothetical protein
VDEGNERSELLVVEAGSAERLLLVEDVGETSHEMLVEDRVSELGAPEGAAVLANEDEGDSRGELLIENWELSAAEGKELLDDDDGVVELGAAEGKVEVDAPPIKEEAAPEIVELDTPEDMALLVVDIWDETAADCWLVERPDDWDELGAANWPLVEVIWEAAAPDSVVEDDDSRFDEDAAPEDSVLALLAEDTCDDEIAVLDPEVSRSDELVWTVDGAAKVEIEDGEPQSVAETVRVTVTAALEVYEV